MDTTNLILHYLNSSKKKHHQTPNISHTKSQIPSSFSSRLSVAFS